jgi:hypothetical protein
VRRVAAKRSDQTLQRDRKNRPPGRLTVPGNRKAERKLLGFSRSTGRPGFVLLLLDRGFDHGLAVEHLDAKVDSFAGVFGPQASLGCAQGTRQRFH